METNRITKGPDTDFGKFLRLIVIFLLMTENPGTKRADYFSENPIDIFSGCSIFVNQFMSGDFLKMFAILSKSPPPPLPFNTNSMKSDR